MPGACSIQLASAWRRLASVFATGAGRLAHTSRLPITPVRGQVSHIPAGKLPKLTHAVCSEGYLTPALNGVHCLGASYVKDRFDTAASRRMLESLLDWHILPGAERDLDPETIRAGSVFAPPRRIICHWLGVCRILIKVDPASASIPFSSP